MSVLAQISLQPMKVVILGPPASGKSTVAEQLCQYYKLHHVRIKSVIEETILKMVSTSCAYLMLASLAFSSEMMTMLLLMMTMTTTMINWSQ